LFTSSSVPLGRKEIQIVSVKRNLYYFNLGALPDELLNGNQCHKKERDQELADLGMSLGYSSVLQATGKE